MIVFKRLGKTIKLTNGDWRGIRRRFDLDKAKLVDKEFFAIVVPCSLCEKYQSRKPLSHRCERCPLYKAISDSHDDPCFTLMNSFLRNTEFEIIGSMIWWEFEDNENARRQVKRLNKIMDEIEGQNRA